MLAAHDACCQATYYAGGLLLHHQWCLLAHQHVRLLAAALPWLRFVSDAIMDAFQYQDGLGQLIRVAPDEFAVALGMYSLGVPSAAATTAASRRSDWFCTDKLTCAAYFEEDM